MQAGARIDIPGESAFFAELDFLLVSGQNNGGDYSTATGFQTNAARTESREFMSYENNNTMLLLNDSRWGYDFDNNIMQITVQVGAMLSTGQAMKNNLHFILKGSYALAPQKWQILDPVSGIASEDAYGFEIDFTAKLHMNKNAAIFYSVGYLSGSDILKHMNLDRDAFAWTMLFGVQGNF